MSVSGAAAGGSLWNGAVCSTCGARYVGSHECSRGDLLRRIADLYDRLDRAEKPAAPAPWDPMAHCRCRVENGGSGICGCVLSAPRITCGGPL